MAKFEPKVFESAEKTVRLERAKFGLGLQSYGVWAWSERSVDGLTVFDFMK